MSETITVALITGVIGLVGAAVGGAATYLTSHETLKHQLDREQQQQKAAARGVARVYQDQIYGANAILRTASIEDRWPGRNDLMYFELPPIEDRRLVQSRLSSRSATRVGDADEAIRAVASIIAVEPYHTLSPSARSLVSNWRKDLERGSAALRELSE